MSARFVRLRISAPVLMQQLLHLDERITLIGASAEVFSDGDVSSLVLNLLHPDAPEGAEEMVPVFQRRDFTVTEVTGTEWWAGGRRLDAEPEP